MAVEWSSATRVRSALKGAFPSNVSGMTTAEIDDEIEQAEGYVKALLGIPSTFTFDSTKKPHLLLRDMATARAALYVLASIPASFTTLSQAAFTADLLAYKFDGHLKALLANRNAIDFILES